MITEAMLKNQSLITQDYLKSQLNYCMETGKFTRNMRTRKFKQGAECGTLRSSGYVIISIDRVLYRAHRLAWLYVTGEWPSDEMDHVNGDRSDNRFVNLRVCNRSQNGFNKGVRRDSGVGVKNVLYYKDWGKYCVRIRVSGKDYNYGPFSSIDEASSVAAHAQTIHHQEFARHQGNI